MGKEKSIEEMQEEKMVNKKSTPVDINLIARRLIKKFYFITPQETKQLYPLMSRTSFRRLCAPILAKMEFKRHYVFFTNIIKYYTLPLQKELTMIKVWYT